MRRSTRASSGNEETDRATQLQPDAPRPCEVGVSITILFLGGFPPPKKRQAKGMHVPGILAELGFIETYSDQTDWKSGMRAGQRVRPWSYSWKSEMTP